MKKSQIKRKDDCSNKRKSTSNKRKNPNATTRGRSVGPLLFKD